jgi:hypothetical protein
MTRLAVILAALSLGGDSWVNRKVVTADGQVIKIHCPPKCDLYEWQGKTYAIFTADLTNLVEVPKTPDGGTDYDQRYFRGMPLTPIKKTSRPRK